MAKEFERLAKLLIPPETITNREWGAYLYLDAIGEVQIGPITHGLEPFTNGGNGTVTLDSTGIDPTTIIGSVHSHGNGNHLPSVSPAGDPRSDLNHLAGMVANNSNPATRLYIVAKNLVNAGQTQFNQINVYNSATAQAAINANTPGPEVNPDAESCPL